MTYLNWPLSQIASDLPGAAEVLLRHNVNVSHQGDKTLQEVVTLQGMAGHKLTDDLLALKANPDGPSAWEHQSNSDLIDHILVRYHERHREQLDELVQLARRVERAHSEHPLCPKGLADHLVAVRQELVAHMQKEELILFPMLASGAPPMAAGPIRVMRAEHVEHARDIEKLYQITSELTLPEDACGTWKALYQALEEFITDLQMHMHLENNVLFERVSHP